MEKAHRALSSSPGAYLTDMWRRQESSRDSFISCLIVFRCMGVAPYATCATPHPLKEEKLISCMSEGGDEQATATE